GWGKALGQLLDLLEAAKAPRMTADTQFVLRSFIPPEVIAQAPEQLISNRFPVRHVPDVVTGFNLSTPLDEALVLEASESWAFRRVDDRRVLAFSEPPPALQDKLGARAAGGAV